MLVKKASELKQHLTIENWTLFVLVVALPFMVSLFSDWRVGLLTSFVAQAIIGLLALRNSN